MPFEMRELVQIAFAKDREAMKQMVKDFAKAYPDVFRRGAAELMKPAPDAKTLREERQMFESLNDPVVFERALKDRIAKTTEQETSQMLYGGRDNAGSEDNA